MILRLNPGGTTPRDNPFWKLGAERGGQVGNNLKKIYAYGLRNGFGMAFDPFSGDLWEQENGDDSFSEINLAEPGFNSGWTQVMGPLERVAQFKSDREHPRADPAPTRRPATSASSRSAGDPRHRRHPGEAFNRLFKLPGSEFSDPEMTWKYEVAPGSIEFLHQRSSARSTRATCSSAPPAAPCAAATSSACGSRTTARGSSDRRQAPEGPRRRQPRQVRDHRERVAALRHELGVTPDLKEGPDGSLFVVSNTQGTVYEIRRK